MNLAFKVANRGQFFSVRVSVSRRVKGEASRVKMRQEYGLTRLCKAQGREGGRRDGGGGVSRVHYPVSWRSRSLVPPSSEFETGQKISHYWAE